MALYRKTTKEKSPQEWVQERKKIAQHQLHRIPDLTADLFSSDDITDFLRLVSRLPSYSFQNLLIIYEKYPNATILAGFPTWQRLMLGSDGSQKVLKPDAIRNGIDLLVPFTNVLADGGYELTWWSVLVFDIRQTNVGNYEEHKSIYISDMDHLPFLHDAVSAVISSVYNRRVVFDPHQDELLASGASGRITERSVTVLRGAREEKVLLWLTEALCQLSTVNYTLSDQSHRLLVQFVQYCLYSMWGLSHPGILPGCHTLIPETERILFVELLQRMVFELHQRIAGFYCTKRSEEADSLDELDL